MAQLQLSASEKKLNQLGQVLTKTLFVKKAFC